jgi:hypothetical protein
VAGGGIVAPVFAAALVVAVLAALLLDAFSP